MLILSDASLRSDWVEHELLLAREKEREEKRDVLCPISLDGTWEDPEKAKQIDPILFDQVKKRYVIDFSMWKDGTARDRLATPAGFEPAIGE